MKDALGDRIKSNYENRTNYSLPRRTYTIIRLDGKAFHTFTKRFKRPFDSLLMSWMDSTTKALCEQISGVKFGYVQSDEISLLLTDFDSQQTQAWFDGRLSKMISVSASIATAEFNKARTKDNDNMDNYALFDSRVFTIPDVVEVENYFIWRQNDCTRNAIQMVAQSCFSHKELQGKKTNMLQEMLFSQKNINFNDFSDGEKRGRIVIPCKNQSTVTYTNKKTKEEKTIDVLRNSWEIVSPPIFTQDRKFLISLIS